MEVYINNSIHCRCNGHSTEFRKLCFNHLTRPAEENLSLSKIAEGSLPIRVSKNIPVVALLKPNLYQDNLKEFLLIHFPTTHLMLIYC